MTTATEWPWATDEQIRESLSWMRAHRSDALAEARDWLGKIREAEAILQQRTSSEPTP